MSLRKVKDFTEKIGFAIFFISACFVEAHFVFGIFAFLGLLLMRKGGNKHE